MKQAEGRFGEICRYLVENFDRSFTNHGLFCLIDTSDVFRSRAGCFVGLRVMEAIAHTQGPGPSSLLDLDRSTSERLTREQLAAAMARHVK